MRKERRAFWFVSLLPMTGDHACTVQWNAVLNTGGGPEKMNLPRQVVTSSFEFVTARDRRFICCGDKRQHSIACSVL